MAHQYFENNEDLDHELHQFDFELLGQKLNFQTDSGVFSRERIDYGSVVLLNASQPILQDLANQDSVRILDVGCGYGPIGIAIAKAFPNTQVTMVDVNERAMTLALVNAKANGVKEQLTIVASDGYSEVTSTQFDLIITNPPIRAGKSVVNRILSDSRKYLKKDGQLMAVLQKKQGAPSALKLLQATYGDVKVVNRDKGYYVIEAVNR